MPLVFSARIRPNPPPFAPLFPIPTGVFPALNAASSIFDEEVLGIAAEHAAGKVFNQL